MDERCIDLRVAAHRARKGNFSESREVVQRVRDEFSAKYSAEIFSAINFCEGVIDYFEHGPACAMDKLARSAAIGSRVVGSNEFVPLSSAWLAACYRQCGKWAEFGATTFSAFQYINGSEDEVIGRLAIVIGDAFQETSQYATATAWYRAAKHFANNIADDSAVSAIIYNRAAVRLFNSRLLLVDEKVADLSACRIDIEAASAENYTEYVSEKSISWGFDIMWGQLLLLRSDYRAALERFDRALDVSNRISGWPSVRALLSADSILVKMKLGAIPKAQLEAEVDAQLNDLMAGDGLSAGDILICLSSLKAISDQMSFNCHSRIQEMIIQYRQRFQAEQTMECMVLSQTLNRIQKLDGYSSRLAGLLSK